LWGRGNEGQIGDGTTLTKTTRVQIAGSWNALTCGNGFTFGKTVENKVFVWGLNSSGQLGINSTQSFSSPVLLEPGPDDSTWNGANTTFYTSITGAQTGIILDNGLLYMAGAGADGRIGNGFAVNRSAPVQIGGRMIPSWTPTQVIIGNSSWAQVSAGDQFTIARTTNNELYAFGTDGDGRTGTTDTGI
jgi:alpha-tubulin suppressor-like RCC1 family protein